ncbi:ANTAR domain-containing response regulator [Uliginosibacterium sediminicola]|uniref:Response regulator n=1 Tax=Uliginosibacterium sediminicola TaxID=2024550 RepID=A0ABU9Z381_9RHOO
MNTHSESILVVEDDAIMQDILCTTLSQAGWRCISAYKAEEALDKLNAEPDIALLLIDLGLPGMSGLELAAAVQKKYKLPFIVLTVDDEDGKVSDAIKAGAMSYLTKPFDTAQLPPIVRTTLARHKDVRQLESALQADRSVSVAIGILMHSKAMSEQSAFNHLRQEARAKRQALGGVAQKIIKEFSSSER